MSITVPCQSGMCLGRTFDLRSLQPGLDIFPEEALATAKITDTTQTVIKYAVIKELRDINNILEVSGDISLKCKAGIATVEGMGSYLKDDSSRDNTLEILARAHVQTVTESMVDLKPKDGWSENVVGTHYIRSITYGGDLICRIRIKCSESIHLQDIKAKVEAGLSLGVVDARAKANFRKMENDLKETSNINISYYSTTLQGHMPRDIDGMLKALDSFKDEVLKLNKGKGVPLKCELQPLSVLNAKLVNVLRDKTLDIQLRTLEDHYDDVRGGRTELEMLTSRRDVDFTVAQEDKLNEMGERIEDVINVFNKVIANLDVTTAGEGCIQMDPAFKAYREKKRTGGFRREVAKFVNAVIQEGPVQTPLVDLPHGSRLDLILVGKTGHGKSATGNTIFGDERFESKLSPSSVTSKCQKECGEVGKRELCIVDTPGTMDTKDPDGTLNEIGTAIAHMPDGYHAFLIVLRIDTRWTPEEQMSITMLKTLFGKDVLMNHAVIVFTHGDLFYKEQKKRPNLTFKSFIESQSGYLGKLIHEANERYVLFVNDEPDPGKKRQQVVDLVKVIDTLCSKNGKKYTNDLFETAGKLMKAEKKREEEEEKKKKKKDALSKFDEEMKIKEAQFQADILESRLKAAEARAELEEDRRKEADRALAKLELEKTTKEAQYQADKLKNEMRLEAAQARAVEEERRKEADQALVEKVGKGVAREAKESGRGCFMADAEVVLEGGEVVRMEDLKVGDRVLAGVSDGVRLFSDVCFFGHRDEAVISEYIEVQTSSVALKMTPDHHVCMKSEDKIYTVPTKDLKLGDKVIVYCSESDSLCEERVLGLNTSTEFGVFSPLTMSGTIVVNSMFVSCYGDYVSPTLSHTLLWPMRQLFRYFPSMSAWVNSPGKSGMPGWVNWCMNNIILPYNRK